MHSRVFSWLFQFLIISCIFLFIGCSSDTSSVKEVRKMPTDAYYDGMGVGPVTSAISMDQTIDPAMAMNGEEIFNAKCITCHQVDDSRKIGPGLKGITKRRRPEWILNQILNPMEMTQKDSLSKELLSIYMAQMTDMELSMEEARAVLEYLWKNDQ